MRWFTLSSCLSICSAAPQDFASKLAGVRCATPRDLDARAADRSRSPVRSCRRSLSEDIQFAVCEVVSLRHVLESRFSGFAELARRTANEAAGECPWKGLADFVEDTRVWSFLIRVFR